MMPKTEEQILSLIDHSLAQIQAGQLVDTAEFDSQMEAILCLSGGFREEDRVIE